jgi:hypothetical protein
VRLSSEDIVMSPARVTSSEAEAEIKQQTVYYEGVPSIH